MNWYTFFCQEDTGRGTIWIESLQLDESLTFAEIKMAGRTACAEAWDCDVENVHCLGVAGGNVQILDWDDLNC